MFDGRKKQNLPHPLSTFLKVNPIWIYYVNIMQIQVGVVLKLKSIIRQFFKYVNADLISEDLKLNFFIHLER